MKNEILVSITEQTKLERDSLAIMLDGGTDELTVSVGFPKDEKIDDTLVQQIVEDSIKNVSEIKIKIEKY